MTIGFTVKDIVHRIAVQFVKASLPNAKKAFYLRAVRQPVLDIHGIASKADFYNVTASPKVIEEGLNAGLELMYYLAADGYRIKTPLFNLRIRIPGEYSGHETSLPEETFPVARLRTSTAFQKYLREKVQIDFCGTGNGESIIAEAIDEATGLVDEVMTIGNLLTIHGSGIKIVWDKDHKDRVGVYFRPKSGSAVRAQIIAVNEPRTLKVLIPTGLKKGIAYQIIVGTQSSTKCNGSMLKKVRDITSDFTLVAA